MPFRGLFIGIDRYRSPEINELACARRDAVALHALFTDTFGGDADLLTDEEATRGAIADKLATLAACADDDVVVIAFSGHGSDTHELVTHDADIDDLARTCLSLDTLTGWFARIPAKQLICILDCCFSGGMGAKVLKVENRPRTLTSAGYLLEQLSGEGRLILTASLATEPAWENQRLGHGLLTHHLIEALTGAEEVRQAGKLGVYPLLEYVTRRVIDAAARIGKEQHPTLRGQLDGRLTWPIFTPGPRYFAAFPERGRPPAIADLQSLAAFGFPPPLLKAWAGAIPGLNALQLAAINDFGLLDGEHLVVSAPTSSGKTMIGELAALKGTLERKRAVFLLPLKALVNDKHQQFSRVYGPFGIRTIRATGETIDDIPALMRGQYDLCLMTYEKFAALALGSPHLLEQLGTVVVDEVQMIADESRGANLEFLLTLLRTRRDAGVEPQVVALSAVIGDTNALEGWLGGRLLRRTERPVPLDEGLLLADGTFRLVDPDGEEQRRPTIINREWRKGSSQDWIIPLVRRLVEEEQQVIVFRESRAEARACAAYLARELGLSPAQAALDALPGGDPSIATEALRATLAAGVAFHVADLGPDERLVVEEQFRAPGTTLRVIVATTTLAMGVNTPASAVIIAGLVHPGPVPVPYSVAEYKNMVGRAGRLGFTERGTSYLLALTPRDEADYWRRYVRGVPEDIGSRFFARESDPRSLVLRVLAATSRATGGGLDAEAVIAFLEGSFGAYQERQRRQGWLPDHETYSAALEDLTRHGLVDVDADQAYHLTELGALAGEGGIEVESMVRLIAIFKDLHQTEISDPVLLTAAQLTVELDTVYIPINKSSKFKEPQSWTGELQQQGLPRALLLALQQGAAQEDGTARAKKAVACLLWISGQPLSDVERILTRHGGGRDGIAGPLRSVAARTCDLLPIVGRVAGILHPDIDLIERGARLLTRLEVGIPAPLVDLAAHTGTRVARGDYLHLHAAGRSSIAALDDSTDEDLLGLLGGDARKLTEVRRAVDAFRQQQAAQHAAIPSIPKYES